MKPLEFSLSLTQIIIILCLCIFHIFSMGLSDLQRVIFSSEPLRLIYHHYRLLSKQANNLNCPTKPSIGPSSSSSSSSGGKYIYLVVLLKTLIRKCLLFSSLIGRTRNDDPNIEIFLRARGQVIIYRGVEVVFCLCLFTILEVLTD